MKEFTIQWVEVYQETRQATFKASNLKEAIAVVKDLKVSGEPTDGYVEFCKIIPKSIKVIKKENI